MDGDITSASDTGEDCHVPLLCDNALIDCEGGLGLLSYRAREKKIMVLAETQKDKTATKDPGLSSVLHIQCKPSVLEEYVKFYLKVIFPRVSISTYVCNTYGGQERALDYLGAEVNGSCAGALGTEFMSSARVASAADADPSPHPGANFCILLPISTHHQMGLHTWHRGCLPHGCRPSAVGAGRVEVSPGLQQSSGLQLGFRCRTVAALLR